MTTKITSVIWIGIKKWWLDILGKRVYFCYLEKEDRKRRLSGQFTTLATIGLGIYYICLASKMDKLGILVFFSFVLLC